MARIQTLKGFRDFFPEECATRNYVFSKWRETAERYGFCEYEVPVLESTELYKKKSGDEIVGQLFAFTDQGGRDVSMRPEITPSLAKMVSARQRDFRKPMRWFQMGPCFRFENKQRGRLREFYQFNADIIGEPSTAADAELIALAIDVMRSLGFTEDDFAIRLSDRRAWTPFLERHGASGEKAGEFLQIIDKLEREKPERTAELLEPYGIALEAVREFMESGGEASEGGAFSEILSALEPRGMAEFVQVDLGIVRGLAYYSGAVFEVFDKKHGMRAVAGGGRYDSLISLISDGSADLPAAGFGMGDVVISDLIGECKGASARLADYLSTAVALDAYVVIADEERRPEALAMVQQLRDAGMRTDYPLIPTKVGKQFQAAGQFQCRAAVVFGREYPQVNIKNLRTRAESEVDVKVAFESLSEILSTPDQGPLIA